MEVTLEVVDPDERDPPRQGVGLGGAHPDQQRADETGPHGGGDPVEVTRCGVGDVEGSADNGREQLDVGPAGNLRHDPAEVGVQVGLAGHHRALDDPAVLDHGRRRLVAGGLDGEDPRPSGPVPSGHQPSGHGPSGHRPSGRGPGGHERSATVSSTVVPATPASMSVSRSE